MAEDTDLIESLLDIEPASRLFALRQERKDIRRHTQGAFRQLVTPTLPGGLSPVERAAVACRVSSQTGDVALSTFYQESMRPIAKPAEWAAVKNGQTLDSCQRFSRLMQYSSLVGSEPGRIGQNEIDGLSDVGLSAQDIVAVTQIAAFVPFQVRLLAGLRALQNHSGGATDTIVEPAMARYTMAEVGWAPRVPPVNAETATDAQLRALQACPPAVRRSTYFLTLAQDPASLEERGALFNCVMYAPRGLPRADRELATAIVSMVNGCVYCTSVHARRFAELTHEPALMQLLLEEGFRIELDAKRRAIVDFAAKLTATPQLIAGADLHPLRTSGLSELEILDLIHAVAMFANANRLMQALGDSTVPLTPP